jgi:uncharacterized membrane protein YdfJ with MMPL/SSD domain
MEQGTAAERRAAHERLSTGALARWARLCATHPWRIVAGWVGIVAILVVLVGTVGGSLRDEFEIRGSDMQKATDLIKAEFTSEQGSVLNIVLAAPEGQRLDTPAFLMSRIREEHVHGLKTKDAIEHGIAAIGRVVVAAAIIMGTVFSAFILNADRISKEFGLLLAVAILTDALIVRMTLVPSFFTLLRERTWYIPGWLDRLLPEATIEPPHDGEPAQVPLVERTVS